MTKAIAATVLLVHDDLATIATVRRALGKAGHTVRLATSAADALSSLRHSPPDLVLLAPAVQGGRGAEVLARLAAGGRQGRMPLVLLGRAPEGVSHPLVSVPVDPAALLAAVDAALAAAATSPERALAELDAAPALAVELDVELSQAQAEMQAEAIAAVAIESAGVARRQAEVAERARALAEEERRRLQTELAAAEAQGTAEAELLAAALREEASRRAAELESHAQMRLDAEARVRRETRARSQAEAEARQARIDAEAARARAEREHTRAEAEEAARLASEEARVRAEQASAQRLVALQAERRAAEQARARAEAEEVARLEAEEARGRAEEARARAEEAAERAQTQGAAREAAEAEAAGRVAAQEAEPESARAVETARVAEERARWVVPETGQVTLTELARLAGRLEEQQATCRLELRAEDAVRVVWMARGRVVGATSSAESDGLLALAVRDGLLDARDERELRLLHVDERELPALLVERGSLRPEEVVPLFQRLTEHRAREALAEPFSVYRLAADVVPPSEARAAVRTVRTLAAEALGRALSVEQVAALTHGLRGVPRRTRTAGLDTLGFEGRLHALLEAVDGERTVQGLVLATGVRAEAGERTLAVASVLGHVEIPVPEGSAPAEGVPEVEVARLEAKWRVVEEADYFHVLGLPRDAASEDVRRAFAQLSAEFDPLRFAGSPDRGLHDRAARLHALLSEAAQALGNDRLREAYARSLSDA